MSNDVRKTQNYVNRYNNNFKFSSQRYFKFNISDFTCFSLFAEDKIDVNGFTKVGRLFGYGEYKHPLAIKGFHNKHIRYVDLKFNLIKKLCKKYHLWSYTSNGRKCDGFDF